MSYALALALGMSVIPFIFAYLSVNTAKEELQILFQSMCLLLVVVDIFCLSKIAGEFGLTSLENILIGMFSAIFWVFFFVIAYFVIMYVKSVFETAEGFTKKGMGK